jgi:hypothetical protein
MIERRVRDFRLDSKLRSACENEIFNMCAYFGVRSCWWFVCVMLSKCTSCFLI